MGKLLIIFVSLAFILGQMGRAYFPNGVAITLLDTSVFLVVLIWLAKSKFIKKEKFSSLDMALGMLILMMIVSLSLNTFSLRLNQALISGLYIVRFAVYAFIYKIVSQNTKSKNLITNSMMGTGTSILIIGFLQYVFYPYLGNLSYLEWDDHLYRLFSTFLDPNFAGAFFCLLLFFLFPYLESSLRLRDWKRMLLIGCIAISTFFAIFLTYSRSAFFMLVSGACVYFYIKAYRRLILNFLIIAIVTLFLLSNMKIEGLNPFRTFSTKARIESITIAAEIIKRNPVFGVGFNAYRYAMNRYGYRTNPEWQVSHADAGTDNSFLFILATTGAVGLVSYLYLLLTILKRGLKAKNNTFSPVVVASLVGLTIDSLFINSLFFPAFMLWMWCLIGLMESM